MHTYLSMGFGRNSVALYLLMLEQGLVPGDPEHGFEAVFINHGSDWPETYEYAAYFAAQYPVTVLQSEYNGYTNLYQYFSDKAVIPFRKTRDCTHKFKSMQLEKYYHTPCQVLVGIDNGEAHRAKIHCNKGVEYRYPLIEHEIDLQGCIDIIKSHGLDVPTKSGCYLCPFQRPADFKRLRREHSDLYCNARKLEAEHIARRKAAGNNSPSYLVGNHPLDIIVNADLDFLPGLDDYSYPPCQCGL